MADGPTRNKKEKKKKSSTVDVGVLQLDLHSLRLLGSRCMVTWINSGSG